MQNKNIIMLILISMLSILFGFLASLINNYVWYIILFMFIIGTIIGFLYNIVLKKFEYTSKNKKFIILSIILSVVIVNFSINYFDYKDAKNQFNKNGISNIVDIKNETISMIDLYMEQNIKGIEILIQDELINKSNIEKIKINEKLNALKVKKDKKSIIELYKNISNKNKTEIEKSMINNLLNTNKYINNKNYLEASKELKKYYQTLYKISGNNKDLKALAKNMDIAIENLKIDDNFDMFEQSLKEQYGFSGQLGFFIFTNLNSGGISVHGSKEVNTGKFGSIAIYIIDLIALFGGIFSMIKVLSILVCKKHNEPFSNFGTSYLFPTISENFLNKDIENILELINTIPEKKGIFAPKTFYVNISFRKCKSCDINDTETVLKINFNHYGSSKKKPIGGIKIYSFLITGDRYKEIIKILENKKLED